MTSKWVRQVRGCHSHDSPSGNAFRKLSIASHVELTRIVIQQAGDRPTGLPTLTMWKDPGATILSLARDLNDRLSPKDE